MFELLQKDISAALERDPAARSKWEVIFTYPSVHALFFYRLSHACWERGWPFLARFIAQFGRFWTGIEEPTDSTIASFPEAAARTASMPPTS